MTVFIKGGPKTDIRNHLKELTVTNFQDGWATTISFTHIVDDGIIRRATVRDIPLFFREMTAYVNQLAQEAYGRRRSKAKRFDDEWIPILCIPECRDLDGEGTHPHWHTVTKFPDGKAFKLLRFTREFFNRRSNGNIRYFYCIDSRKAHNPAEWVAYSSKMIDEDTTIQYSIDRGLLKP